ncbi:MAG: PAS domain S-box protein, partial [Bacteroidetes bacterium]|nr:PAS domain S-box protein [Bacteroidota bacterium]
MKRSRLQSSAQTKRGPAASSPRSGKPSRTISAPASAKKTKQLLFSDERYRKFFSMTTDSTILADDSGRCLDANSSACSLLGFSRKDLMSRSIVNIIAESDAGTFRSFWKKFLKDGSMTGELLLKTRSGRERFVEIRSVANVSDGVHVVTIRDLTEQKNALIAAQQNEQRYKAFIRNSSEGIWCFALKRPVDITLPVKTQIKRFFDDAYLLECNDEYARMYGYSSASEIIGARLEDVLVKDDPKNIQYLKDFIHSKYHQREVETVEQDKNGRRFSVVNNLIGTIVDGKLVGAWGTQHDVTETRRQEEELRTSKDAYEELVHKIPFVVYKWRRRADGERRLEYVSPQIKELVGIPAEKFLKEQSLFVSMIHPDDRRVFVERNREYDEHPVPFIYECRTTFNGAERWIQFNSTPQILTNGDVVWDGILQDITERKRAEELIRVSGNENRMLAEAANALAGFTTEDKVFSYIASILEHLVPNSVVVLSALRPDEQTVIVRNISGLSGMLGKTARSILGFDPATLEFKIDPALRKKHSDPHLHRYEDGIHQVAPTILSKKVASRIQSLLKFQDVYSIGITGSSVHGFIHLFCYDEHSKQDLGVIEPFVHLCTMSLEKIRSFTEITESEQRYRLLADNAADVVWVMNFDGTFKYISPSITALRGYTVEELMDLSVDRHVCASSLPTIGPLMERAKKVLAGIEADRSPDVFEIEQPCKDGSTIWVEVNAKVVFDDHQKPYGVLGVSHNITKRKRAEEELRRTNNENRFLVETSLALAGCSSERDVYGVIRKQLQQLIPGCVLFIMNTSEDGQKSIVAEIAGVDSSVLSAGMKLLRYDPVGKSFDNMKGWAELFCKPQLHTFTGGLYELSTGVIPKFLAPKIEKLLGVKGFHSIGIAEENSYLGYIHIFTKQPDFPVLHSTIETFVHQCHLALTKIASQTQMADEAHRRMTMMNTSGDGIAIIDQQHRVIECNPRFARMLGYSMNELLGMHTWDFEDHMSESEIRKHFSDLSSINTIFETQHRRKDGSVYDVEVNASGTSIGGQAMIFVVCRDITERKEMITALRNSEEKHRTLFDTMAQGVVYHDHAGAIVSANPAAERLLGISLDQIVGRTSLDPRWHCIHEDGTPFPGETHPAMVSLRTGKQVLGTMMGVFNPRTSSYTWILVDAVPQYRDNESTPFVVYTSFEDMTERKQIEEERRERLEQIKRSEESYRGLFNSVQDAIYIQNEAGEFLDVNDGAVAMYGYSREELIGKTPAFVSAPDRNDHFCFPEMVGEVMNGTPRHFEFWGKRKNGEIFPKSVALYRGVYFGKPVVIALAQDITVRKQQELEIHQKNNQLLSLIHSQTNYLVRTDLNGCYTFVNDRFCETFGFTRAEIIGKPSSLSYEHEGEFIILSTAKQCVENPGKEFPVTIHKKHANGTILISDWEFIAL